MSGLTDSAQDILIELHLMTDAMRLRCKLAYLVSVSGVPRSTTKLALKRLVKERYIWRERPIEHGPDAVYQFGLTQAGKLLAGALCEVRGRRGLS